MKKTAYSYTHEMDITCESVGHTIDGRAVWCSLDGNADLFVVKFGEFVELDQFEAGLADFTGRYYELLRQYYDYSDNGREFFNRTFPEYAF